ncbi:MAG: hypothetical protein M3Z95_07110 [Actinomycetota bacterium]|nr:hypothetical protein [Actinomycetota bacterium]
MRNLQPVIHNQTLVAVIVAGRAVIDDTLSDHLFRHAQAMCLYALELAEEGCPQAYTDADADAYARAALAPR